MQKNRQGCAYGAAQNSRQFALYGVIGARAEQTFSPRQPSK
jgi:hypothetical protein